MTLNVPSPSSASITAAIGFTWYKSDGVTTTGTGNTTTITLGSNTGVSTQRADSTLVNTSIPLDAAFMLITITFATTGTVSTGNLYADILEVSIVSGKSDVYVAENSTPSSNAPARLRQSNGVLTILPATSITLQQGSAAGDIIFKTSAGATILTVNNASNVVLETTGGYRQITPPTTTQTTSQAIWFNTSGTTWELRRNSSSNRYKTDITDADATVLEAAKKIKPRHYRSTIESEDSATRLGFIAEEIDAAGLTHAVGYDSDGRPETIDPTALLAALYHRVNELEERLAALESK